MYNVCMAFTRPTLPEKTDPKYVPALIDACVAAFEHFLDDGLALDYMGVSGKTRPIVLDNEDYQIRTRMVRAERFMEEIDDVDGMIKDIKASAPTETSVDIRNPKEMDEFTKDFKETLGLRMKLTQMRRDLLDVTKQKETEEVDALNVFFIALTPEEFAAMGNVETHEGTDSVTLQEEVKKEQQQKSSGLDEEDDTPENFIIGEDGSIEEIVPA